MTESIGDREASHAKEASDVGQRVVEHLYKLSQVDSEWSIRHPRGFTWWAWKALKPELSRAAPHPAFSG